MCYSLEGPWDIQDQAEVPFVTFGKELSEFTSVHRIEVTRIIHFKTPLSLPLASLQKDGP